MAGTWAPVHFNAARCLQCLQTHNCINVLDNNQKSAMSSSESFRRRDLQPHQRVNETNDRSSYEVRQVTELDVLSAIGSVVNAPGGRGVIEFTQCEGTRMKWLRLIERSLLERHLTRLLQFAPSLEDAYSHLNDASDIGLGEGLNVYKKLIHFTVFALMQRDTQHTDELQGFAKRPGRVLQMLCCARQRASPILVSWLLDEDAGDFQQLAMRCEVQLKVLDMLRAPVRQEMEMTRAFITKFLQVMNKEAQSPEMPMATHVPETFICEGYNTDKREMALLDIEVGELQSSYGATHCGKEAARFAVRKDILDPSLRCRISTDNATGTAFQWLPADFYVGANGDVAVRSPLHASVHPHQFPGLCAGIPLFLQHLVPLFERVLGSIATRDPPPPQRVGLGSKQPRGSLQITPSRAWSLRDRQLQVVVKLSTIHLDADQPIFDEHNHVDVNRDWQLEGDNHEHIVAVGYHVLRSRNTTSPKLAFRAFSHCPPTPEDACAPPQEDVFLAFGERTSSFFGGRYGRQFLQPCGSLALHEGRSIAAPNLLAHRLEPFELLDAGDPEGGELTWATFYLVDPSREPIVSTRTVHPGEWQQTRRFVQGNVNMLRCNSTLPFLPDEVARQIAAFAFSPISESQAQVTRAQLLATRQKLQELRFLTPSLRLNEMQPLQLKKTSS